MINSTHEIYARSETVKTFGFAKGFAMKIRA